MYSFQLPFSYEWNTVCLYSCAKEDHMATSSTATPPAPSSYELIGRRIQRTVADPKVQKIQRVTVTRREDEPADAWDRVLRELEETDGVTVDRDPDGSVSIGWKQYIDR
jgi:hypothetical protein